MLQEPAQYNRGAFSFLRTPVIREIAVLLVVKVFVLFAIYQIWFSQTRITEDAAIEAHLIKQSISQ